ncbi:MAG TPA: DUF2934 domain-containing protein [Allocoleopsis sp.]
MTYCYGENCPLREDCRRFPLPKIARRNTFTYTPYNPITQTCEHFLQVYKPSQKDIETQAYYIWLREGCPSEKALDHWLIACQNLLFGDNK